MKELDTTALILTAVGGLNWGLIAVAKFDLVAKLLGGMNFGETNVASRIVYGLVGLSAVYLLTRIKSLVANSKRATASV